MEVRGKSQPSRLQRRLEEYRVNLEGQIEEGDDKR